MKKIAILSMAAALAVTCLAGCAATTVTQTFEDEAKNRDCVYQISTLQALTASDFYGAISVEDFMKRGDIGIGTFEGVNGEMIVLDGVCYQALADGTVVEAAKDETVPFGAITYFDSDIQQQFSTEMDFEQLKATLDGIVKENGANMFYVGTVKGTFPKIQVRAITKQEEPYRTLDVATTDSQKIFDYENVTGTLVAVYCPAYAGELNAAGWHIHFLSDEKDKGGHVLGLTMAEGALDLDRSDSVLLDLPNDEYFSNLDVSDQEEAVGVVEQGK